MKMICEMFISGMFRLSSGHTAIVGRVEPNIEFLIPCNSKADLHVSGKKIKSINIIGEDKFLGVDEFKLQDRRSIRCSGSNLM